MAYMIRNTKERDVAREMQNNIEGNPLPPLNLPPCRLKFANADGMLKVYDGLRDKFVALTPEEYVRQHFVNYMIQILGYPKSLMANETGIELNGVRKRCDTVVFRPDGTPQIIVEYKAPTVSITQDVFDQIATYNMKLRASYLIVSNGMTHYCCRMNYESENYCFIPRIPDYTSLVNPYSNN